MMTRFLSCIAVLGLCLAVAPSLTAEDKTKDDKKADTKNAPQTEQEFLANAIACNTGEIKLAEMAQKRAASDEVKKFAQHVIEDHKKLQATLEDRAKELKLGVVQGLEKDYKEKEQRLSKAEGAAFDKEFMQIMIESHEKGIRDAEAQAKSTKDAELRTALEKGLPKMKEHLEEARKIAKNLK